MVVVGIIGILASLALPKLQVFMAKSKQSEAKVILPTVYSLEQSYYADNNVYLAVPNVAAGALASVPALGLNVTAKYFALAATLPTTTTFTATATAAANALCPGSGAEAWSINESKTLLQGGVAAFAAPTCN